MNKLSLSIIIPVFNSEKILPSLVENIIFSNSELQQQSQKFQRTIQRK